MYDYMLGGRENFQADREAAERILKLLPGLRQSVQDTRAFLRRAVRYLVERGIDQFLDIGAGLPTQDNVHNVAHAANPDVKVAYVDRDPLVVSHGNALLAKSEHVIVEQADLRRPEELLSLPSIEQHLDLARPVAVILLNVLNFISDDDNPAGIVAALKDALCPGSYLVIGHVTPDHVPPHAVARALATYEDASDNLWPRGKDQVLRFFDGFTLVEPGLTTEQAWYPPDWSAQDNGGAHRRTVSTGWVGIGRKPLRSQFREHR